MKRPISKTRLVHLIAIESKISHAKAETLVNAVINEISNSLIKGLRVKIRGFGSFSVKHYDEYKGRNPRTGEIIQVPPKNLPFFKTGKQFKNSLNK